MAGPEDRLSELVDLELVRLGLQIFILVPLVSSAFESASIPNAVKPRVVCVAIAWSRSTHGASDGS